MSTYNDYVRQMKRRFIHYRHTHYPLEYDLFDPRREHVFKAEFAMCNLVEWDLIDFLPKNRRHTWFSSMTSSQALAVSVFGTLLKRQDLQLLAQILDKDGHILLDGFEPAGKPVFDLALGTLNERTPTSIDLFWPGKDGHVAIECKLMEREIGTCSRVPRFCDGKYVPGKCWLTQRGMTYWQHIPRVLTWDTQKAQSPCPLAFTYQLVRTLLGAAIDEQGQVKGRPTAVLVYDTNNPFFTSGHEAELFKNLKQAVRPPARLARISWQSIAYVLQAHGQYENLLSYLDEKYGIRPGVV
ncbi:MAG: hypothetical protein JW934_20000 [Anaerolineae bacterium]|nr:hypothetical protein [Anaerolineae bacterium]